jgi:PTH1 family peptidyl-tRNA hydrolase
MENARPREKFFAETVAGRMGEREVLLVSPLTFMNESGKSVRQVVDFYRVEFEDLLIVCDDFNLPLGRIRLRGSGSAGGQNGLDDILLRLGTQNVPRLRSGIGPLPDGWSATSFVLGRFAAADLPTVEAMTQRAADACEVWLAEGLVAAMARFNAKTEP